MSKTKEVITIALGAGVTLGIRNVHLQAAIARLRRRLKRMLKPWGVTAVFLVASVHHPDARLVCRCPAMAAQNTGQQTEHYAHHCTND
ncbi:MAG TPA: hypothetical protein VFR24_13505 [Candidatus Angelobacter sp.]|nr:hypothetical protein [Candidatus Angelobacter sp.]